MLDRRGDLLAGTRRSILDQDRELVAPHPCERRVTQPHGGARGRDTSRKTCLHPPRDVHQQPVACLVAESVVDSLEPVQVQNHHHRRCGRSRAGAGDRGLQTVCEQGPVRQAGERIVQRVVDQGQSRTLALDHTTQLCTDLAHDGQQFVIGNEPLTREELQHCSHFFTDHHRKRATDVEPGCHRGVGPGKTAILSDVLDPVRTHVGQDAARQTVTCSEAPMAGQFHEATQPFAVRRIPGIATDHCVVRAQIGITHRPAHVLAYLRHRQAQCGRYVAAAVGAIGDALEQDQPALTLVKVA